MSVSTKLNLLAGFQGKHGGQHVRHTRIHVPLASSVFKLPMTCTDKVPKLVIFVVLAGDMRMCFAAHA